MAPRKYWASPSMPGQQKAQLLSRGPVFTAVPSVKCGWEACVSKSQTSQEWAGASLIRLQGPERCCQPDPLSSTNFKLFTNPEPLGWVFDHISGTEGKREHLVSLGKEKIKAHTTPSVMSGGRERGCYLNVFTCSCPSQVISGRCRRR